MTRATLIAIIAALSASPMAAQRPAATDPQPLAIGVTFTIDSRVLDETRRINVWAPPEYVDSDDLRLPVLYMPDGGIGEDFLHVAGLLQISVLNGTMRPFLLVGIENTQRRRDLTPTTDDPRDREIAPQVGGSADFRAFLRSELMTLIAERYRVTDERAIIGESLAGLFIVETFLVEPDLFDTYIAFDPSLWWDRGRLVQEAGDRVRTVPPGRTLYVASSSEPLITEQTAPLARILEEHAGSGLTWQYRTYPDETHGTIYHPAALDAVRALFVPDAR